jgi:hypothetical protein
MALTSQLTQFPPNDLVAGDTPVQQLMAAHLVPHGRIVNYDPQTYASYPDSPQGVPDLNIISGMPSVSGYASIVNGTYESVTQTHQQDELDIGQLGSGALGRLNLREVVSVPQYFLVPLESMPRSIDDIRQVSEPFGADPVLPRGFGADFNDTAYPFYPGPRHPVRAGQSASWFFGESLRPSSATLVLSGALGADTLVRFGILTADGSTRWGAPVTMAKGARRITAALPGGDAVGLSVKASGLLPSLRTVITVAGHLYELGGSLSSALVPGPWQLAGFSQGYAVFTFRRPAMPFTASTTEGRHVAVQVLSSTTKSEVIRVHAPAAARVLRSVAWDSGWKASVSVNGGAAQSLPVDSYDLVQEVHVPAGDDVITFHYRPPHLLPATVLSLGSSALLIVMFAVWLWRRPRSRRRPPDGRHDVGPIGASELALPDEPEANEPVPNEPVPNEPVPNEPVPNEPVPNEPVPNQPERVG